VGWIPLGRLAAEGGAAGPLWLGVVALGSARYAVPGPGRVIFRTADPTGLTEERHQVTYRVLCRRTRGR